MYSVVVFDCDGTLVDCSRMIVLLKEGYHRMYPKRPKLSYKDFIPCYYMSNHQIKTYLHISKEEEQSFHDICFGRQREKMHDVKAFEGIKKVWEELYQSHIRIGINTSRNYLTFSEIKNQMGHTFAYIDQQLIITLEDIKEPKPSPESLLLLQKRAGCSMSEILYVGDSLLDALCAEAAGCDFAAARWGMVQEQKMPLTYDLLEPKDLLHILWKKQ